jgi:molybdate transport system permease protein
MSGRRSGWFAVALTVALGLTLVFLTVPILAIFVDTGPLDLVSSLGDEGALEALRLSLVCSAVAVAIIVVVGTPAAYLLATRRFRGRAAVVTLIELPLVLPPAVAGIGLLAALGPNGVLGGLVEDAGVQLVLTTAGVIVALTFVSAPFYLRQAQAAFESLDRTWLDASRTLGASEARTFLRIAIPALASSPGSRSRGDARSASSAPR